MQKDGRGRVAIKNMAVLFAALLCRIKYMTEKLLAKLLEEKILGLKVGVKRGSAHVGPLNDLFHCDLAVMLFGKKLAECLEDRLSRFFLPSVHVTSVQYRGFVRYRTLCGKYPLTFWRSRIILIPNDMFGIIYIVPYFAHTVNTEGA